MDRCLELTFKNVHSDDDYNIELFKDINVEMKIQGHGLLNKVGESDLDDGVIE